MKHLLFLILLICTLDACQSKPENSSVFETLSISKSIFNGEPIIGDFNDFSALKSGNFSLKDSCIRIGIPFKQGTWLLDCLTPTTNDNTSYARYKNIVILNDIKFEEDQFEIIFPELVLNNKTTIESLKEIFPISYKTLNKGANTAKLNDEEWMYFVDDLPSTNRPASNQIELRFKDNKLIRFYYYWKPEMTDDQLTEYKRISASLRNEK